MKHFFFRRSRNAFEIGQRAIRLWVGALTQTVGGRSSSPPKHTRRGGCYRVDVFYGVEDSTSFTSFARRCLCLTFSHTYLQHVHPDVCEHDQDEGDVHVPHLPAVAVWQAEGEEGHEGGEEDAQGPEHTGRHAEEKKWNKEVSDLHSAHLSGGKETNSIIIIISSSSRRRSNNSNNNNNSSSSNNNSFNNNNNNNCFSSSSSSNNNSFNIIISN